MEKEIIKFLKISLDIDIEKGHEITIVEWQGIEANKVFKVSREDEYGVKVTKHVEKDSLGKIRHGNLNVGYQIGFYGFCKVEDKDKIITLLKQEMTKYISMLEEHIIKFRNHFNQIG